MVCGCLLDASGRIVYAGMTYDGEGKRLLPYSGYPADESGYMAVTKIIRNISGPDPFCVAVRRELWEQVGGFNQAFNGPHALLDLALRAMQKNWRIVYNPQAVFTCREQLFSQPFPRRDGTLFARQWNNWLLAGDPCYSPKGNWYFNSYLPLILLPFRALMNAISFARMPISVCV